MRAALAPVVCALVLVAVSHAPAAAQELAGDACYVMADSDAPGAPVQDLLVRVALPDPATAETAIGSGTDTDDIRAIAFQPDTGMLFAAESDLLGTLDLVTGLFGAVGEGLGQGTGPAGAVGFNDVRGLAFDPATGFLYATHRSGTGNDILFRIDPGTGSFVAGAFGGQDYVVIEGPSGLPDIADIAIDPAGGEMYAIAGGPGGGDRLVRVDTATGGTGDAGPLGVDGIEGLAFAGDRLLGVTGFDNHGLWDIDTATGAAANRRAFTSARDYWAVACLAAAAEVLATIVVVSQETRPDSRQEFFFAVTGGPLRGTFTLAAGGSRSYAGLPTGEYAVTQTAVEGWPLESLECTDPGGGTITDLATATATVVLEPGDEVTCVFVNGEAAREPAAAPDPGPAPAPEVAPAPAPEVAPVAELPRTGPARSPWALLAGLLLSGGGAGVALGAPRRRRTRR